MPYKSIWGKEFGLGPNGPLFNGRPVYNDEVGNGATWYVSSVINGGDGSSPFNAAGTIDAAINKCAAGDKIVVLEGHAETISSATAINCDVANVMIIGLGEGKRRPTITFDTATTTTIPVTAAGVHWDNIIFTANFADIVSFFTLTTANNFRLTRNLFKSTATNMNSLYVVDTDATSNNADGMLIRGNRWVEPDLATVGWIKMDGTNDDLRFIENYSNLGVLNNKSLITVAAGKLVTNLQMLYNNTIRLNTDTATGGLLFHTDGSTNSGIVAGNFSQHADTAAELIVTASSGLSLFQNYSSGVNGNSGYVIATIDS